MIQLHGTEYFFEKFIFTELVKKFYVFHSTCRFINMFTKVRHWTLS